MDCISPSSNAMQISDLYRQTKLDGTLRPTPPGERSRPAAPNINRRPSKIPEIAIVGSPREWFFRIAVLF
jgi:hypothetical protein